MNKLTNLVTFVALSLAWTGCSDRGNNAQEFRQQSSVEPGAPQIADEPASPLPASMNDGTGAEDKRASLRHMFFGNVASRQETIALLVASGSSESIGLLFEFLKDMPDGVEKNDAVQQSAKLTGATTLPVLVQAAVASGDASALRIAQEAFVQLADERLVLETTARFDASNNPAERAFLAESVAKIRNEEAVPGLVALLQGTEAAGDEPLMRSAITALRSIASPVAVDALLQKLDSTADEAEQVHLANAIAKVSDPRAEASLQQALQGSKLAEKPATRAAALAAMANFPTPETIQFLRAFAQDADPIVSTAAVESMQVAESRAQSR